MQILSSASLSAGVGWRLPFLAQLCPCLVTQSHGGRSGWVGPANRRLPSRRGRRGPPPCPRCELCRRARPTRCGRRVTGCRSRHPSANCGQTRTGDGERTRMAALSENGSESPRALALGMDRPGFWIFFGVQLNTVPGTLGGRPLRIGIAGSRAPDLPGVKF